MAATISDYFKRDLLETVYNSFYNLDKDSGQDSDRYYMGIGRAEEWDSTALYNENTPPVPNPSVNETFKFQESLQSIKLISDASYVVPRYNWTAGNVYESWDNEFSSNTTIGTGGDIQNPYYVITDENAVFVCILQGKDNNGNAKVSTVKPTDTTGEAFQLSDNYVWQFLYTVGAAEARKYLTSAYIPVEKILDSTEGGPKTDALSTSRANQLAIQKAAPAGRVVGIAVDSGGTGYDASNPPTVTIVGERLRERGLGDTQPDSAQAYVRINSSGKIFEVVMKSDSSASTFSFGSEYRHASVKVSGGGGGSGALLRAITSGDSGMGGNPVENLNSSAIMFSTTITGVENNDFNVANDFRQVGIIKNPQKDSAERLDFSGDSNFAATTGQVYKRLFLASGYAGFKANLTGDQTVTQTTSGASGILNYFEDKDSYAIAYIHQTRNTGFTRFDSTNSIEFFEAGLSLGTATIKAVDSADGFTNNLRYAEADRFTGEVIYIDNRTKITRDDEQTEDIKIVIDL